ncbi:hypothetical protein TrVGV298_003303 [Trichoderma virens]|nr:hypothetical protein TrVGV298_003303 [Trichoderma virens]
MDVFSDISEGISGILQKQKSEHREEVLNWLTPTNYASQQHDYFRIWQPGTGNWFIDSTQYQAWCNTPGELLFCQGIPGAGKTILASLAIDQLTTKFHDNMDTGIAYIYFDYRQREERAEKLLLSLLKQLVQKRASLPAYISALYEQHKDQRIPPSLEAISLALQEVAKDYSQAYIIVDALDECSNDCRMRFLTEILSLRNKSAVNIFATSRPNANIASKFKDGTLIEVSARDEDIREYLNGNMHRLPDFVFNDVQLRSEVETMIINSAQGMFLLAKLHLNSLVGKVTIKDVRNALEKLSVGSEACDHAYEEMMKRIDNQHPDQKAFAMRALSWIFYAKKATFRDRTPARPRGGKWFT